MNDWLTALRDGATQLGLTLTATEEGAFARLLALLLERNAQFNLTAITDPVEVAYKHFVDALTVEKVAPLRAGERLIDIGTGAGFPGLPLAIRHPGLQVTLNDSARKKVAFLDDAVAALELANAHPLWARAEELGRLPAHRGQYHFACARAVAHLGALIEYALPLLRPGGHLIAMKGPGGEREIAESATALAALGGAVTRVETLHLPVAGNRLLIVVRATRAASSTYPRNAAIMKKRPLFLDSRRPTS